MDCEYLLMVERKKYRGTTINSMLHDNVSVSAAGGMVRLLTRTYKGMVYFVAVFDEFSGCM